ncbi:MAG: L,D-transpeptidase family protein [Sulfurimonas sp.]
MMFAKFIQNLAIRIGAIAVLFISSHAFAVDACNSEFEELVSEVMIETLNTDPQKGFLVDLYQEILFVPVWIEERTLSRRAKALFSLIKEDRTLPRSSNLFKKAAALEMRANDTYTADRGLNEKIELEFALSELYKKYAEFRLFGSIDWDHFYSRMRGLRSSGIFAGWVHYRPEATPLSLLEDVMYHEGSLKKAFLEAEPKKYRYAALKQALFSYLDLQEEGGWEPVSLDKVIRTGHSSDLVPVIRERLRITDDYRECPVENSEYDDCLKASIVGFQKRHGLSPDGVIGKRTIKALNRSPDERIRLIQLNLDRIKWLHQREETRHIIVNIPAFTLYFEEEGKLRLQMKVITGKRRNSTPVFSNTVQHIVLNPFWNVPKSIIQKELIPQILKNPNAMKEEGIDIYTGWARDAEKVDVGSVNWKAYRYTKNMPFRFAQPPGNKNALGKVKFLFPNRFSVYMHDTPAKSLFRKTVRAFSHGCIRLEKPIEMLRVFTSFNQAISFEAAEKRLRGNRRQFVKLDQTVPVDVVYLTAWVDYDGIVQFRNDIYGYDKIQLSTLKSW